MVDEFGDAEELGSFIAGLEEWGKAVEPVGILRAVAWPGGLISHEALERLTGALRERVEKAGPLDGLLLSLHGALVAENDVDADGALLETT